MLKMKIELEIEIRDDIAEKYHGFWLNYEDERDFAQTIISSMEHNTTLDECEVWKNLHPQFENKNYVPFDDGYQIKITSVKEVN
jgi:hypothetical protein